MDKILKNQEKDSESSSEVDEELDVNQPSQHEFDMFNPNMFMNQLPFMTPFTPQSHISGMNMPPPPHHPEMFFPEMYYPPLPFSPFLER